MRKSLEKEFELIEIDDFIKNIDEARVYIAFSIDEINKLKNDTIKAFKLSYREFLFDKLRGVFCSPFGLEVDLNFARSDLKIIKNEIELLDNFLKYQCMLYDATSEDNYSDIYKLSKYTDTILVLNYNYLEECLDVEYYNSKGISYSSDRDDICNNKDDFDNFFNLKYNELNTTKVLKKML